MQVEIDLGSRRVDEIDTEHAVTLVLSGGAAIRIEGTLDLVESDGETTTVDPENISPDLGLGSILRHRVIQAATTDRETGVLLIAFYEGLALRVPPDPMFEAWSASWADGATLVALPGGGLSSWGAQP